MHLKKPPYIFKHNIKYHIWKKIWENNVLRESQILLLISDTFIYYKCHNSSYGIQVFTPFSTWSWATAVLKILYFQYGSVPNSHTWKLFDAGLLLSVYITLCPHNKEVFFKKKQTCNTKCLPTYSIFQYKEWQATSQLQALIIHADQYR